MPASTCCPRATGATVIEVNGVAAWQGLQRVTPFNIAQALVDDLLDRKCAGDCARLSGEAMVTAAHTSARRVSGLPVGLR
jgi:hypothetical protein